MAWKSLDSGMYPDTRITDRICRVLVAGAFAFFAPFSATGQDAIEDIEAPLFVPVVPGEPPPTAPIPQVTPLPFVPSAIPAPAIQSQPITVDYVETPELAPTPTPFPFATPRPIVEPTPVPTPASTPRPQATPARAAQTRTTPARSTQTSTATYSQSQIARLADSASRNRSSKTAEQLGWIYYNKNDFSSASHWFEQAVEWNPSSSDAAYGMALSKFRAGELMSAESIAAPRVSNPKMRTLMGDIYVRRAMDAYEVARYRESIKFFDQAKEFRPLSRNEQIVLAWDYRQAGRSREAAEMFEQLYRARPDQASAEGLYSSLSKLKEYDRLTLISEEVPGPLEGVYETEEPQSYFKAGLFRASYEMEGEKVYPILENITSPSLEVGFAYRQKSGQEGESQLTETRAPYLEARFYPSNRAEIIARISAINLESGDLSPGANVGTVPLEFTPYSFKPTTSENDLIDFSIRFEYQDWLSPYIELGTTPLNGPLSPRAVGRAGVVYRHSNGYVQAEFFSRSIKETMLSYVGIVDPYTGETWGRVTETGLAASVFQSVAPDWTLYVGGSVGQINGTNVEKNQRVALTAALAKELNVEGFEYFTLGPAISYEAYENNQNFFTYGHGGYFSPDYIAQIVIGANFLTTEGEQWLVKGNVSAGLQTNKQSSAPYFPLNPDGREYPGTTASSGVLLLEVDGGFLIAENWMLGGSLAYTVTADYDEGWASIYVRYFFERRNGLLRSDLSRGSSFFR